MHYVDLLSMFVKLLNENIFNVSTYDNFSKLRSYRSIIWILIILSIFVPTSVEAAGLYDRSSISTAASRAGPRRLSLSNIRPICTNQADWMLDGEDLGQVACAELLNQYHTAIGSFRLDAFEFAAVSAPPRFRLPIALTPKKWTWRKFSRLSPHSSNGSTSELYLSAIKSRLLHHGRRHDDG